MYLKVNLLSKIYPFFVIFIILIGRGAGLAAAVSSACRWNISISKIWDIYKKYQMLDTVDFTTSRVFCIFTCVYMLKIRLV